MKNDRALLVTAGGTARGPRPTGRSLVIDDVGHERRARVANNVVTIEPMPMYINHYGASLV